MSSAWIFARRVWANRPTVGDLAALLAVGVLAVLLGMPWLPTAVFLLAVVPVAMTYFAYLQILAEREEAAAEEEVGDGA